MAQERSYIRGNGGGGSLTTNIDPIIELVLKIINWKTVVGLENTLDSNYGPAAVPAVVNI